MFFAVFAFYDFVYMVGFFYFAFPYFGAGFCNRIYLVHTFHECAEEHFAVFFADAQH